MSEQKKIAFMFGAGAEGKGNYNLPNGAEYVLSMLHRQTELKDNVLGAHFQGEYFKEVYPEKPYKYRKDTMEFERTILKRIVEFKAAHEKTFYEKYFREIHAVISDSDALKMLENNWGKQNKSIEKDESSQIKKEIETEFERILKSQSCKRRDIQLPFCRELFEEDNNGNIVFDYQNGLSGLLDSYFHTIINPTKYGVGKFSRIFNFYWACYFAIVNPLLNVLIASGNKNFEKYCKNGECNYKKIIEHIDLFTKELYNVQQMITENTTYYACIKKYLEKNKNQYECTGILTTNYYNFCEQIPSKKFVYLNGQLKYFEYPENLEVVDFSSTTKKEEKIFFPFIFGQSHVKPIVHSTQTEAFAMMKQILNEVEVLVVLGYGISEDDNHINAFLHEFLNEKNKKLLYITDFATEELIAKCLRLEECWREKLVCNCEMFDKANNEKVIENIFKRLEEML